MGPAVGARPSRPALLVAALGAAALFGASYGFLVLTLPGQWLDAEVFGRLQQLGRGFLGDLIPTLGRQVVIAALGAVALDYGFRALARGAWRELAVAVLTVGVSVPVAWRLRQTLPRPDLGSFAYPENTLPSTHAAAAAALLVTVVLLWPSSVSRGEVYVLTAAGALASLGNVVGHAHRPADVLAAFALVGAVASLAGAVFRPRLPPLATPRRGRPRSAPR